MPTVAPSTTTNAPRSSPGPQWSVLAPPGCAVIELPGGGKRSRAGLSDRLRALPPGVTVLLLDGRRGSRARLRSLA